MKQLIATSLLLFPLLLSGTVFAQTETSTTTASTTESGGIISDIIQNVSEIGQGVKEQIQGEQKAALEKRTQERITNLAANISNRFDGIIARLQNIIDRIDKRIEKQAGLGYDVTAAKNSLGSAQTSLDQAKAEMRGIDAAVNDALGSTDPRGEWKNVRQKFINARDSIRIAHAELRNTIINLKTASNTPTETASSTPN